MPYVFPILGGRKLEHLKQNIAGLSLRLTDEDVKILEAASPLVPNFPYDLFGYDYQWNIICIYFLSLQIQCSNK